MAGSGFTVIHVTTETGWRGGEQQVKLLTDGLSARGHRCVVLCPPNSRMHANRAAAGMAEPLYYLTELDVFAASRLASLVRQTGAHLIHAQTGHAHTLAWLAARKVPVPAVVSRRVDFPVSGNRLSRAKYLAPHVFYLAISKAVKSVLMAGGVPEQRIGIVHSGVDPGRFACRETASREEKAARWFGAAEGTFLIANVAALTDHKDQATLLRAAAVLRRRLPEFRLVIAGSGELEAPLRALQAELGLESHVEFLGHVQDLAPLYRAADLFVMSSHLEGLCTSILDAMAAGVPVVATRAGGIPEIVRDGLNGLLVPVRDPDALAVAMESALRSPMLREMLSRAGRRTVEEEFSSDRMVDGTVAQYKSILAQYHRALAAGRAALQGATPGPA